MNNSIAASECKPVDYISNRLLHLIKTDRPEKRSWAGRRRLVGLTPAERDKANDDRESFARHRITIATLVHIKEGRKITRRSIERMAGSSPHTVVKHKDIWQTNIAATLKRAARIPMKLYANLKAWLLRFVAKVELKEKAKMVQAVNRDNAESKIMETNFTSEDGEVFAIWTPSPNNQKPPRNYAAAANSSKKEITAAKNPDSELVRFPVPPPKSPTYVSCPPEIRAQLEEQFHKYSLQKAIRDERYRVQSFGKAKTHIERLEYSDCADQNWYEKNKDKIASLFGGR